jgi:hypothetical protein
MLSKEEISKLKINVFNQCDDETIRLVAEMLKHTKQLESEKQKLIEKLKEDIREETGYAKWTNSYTKEISPAVTRMISKSKYAQEILSILKGENHDNQARIYRDYK